MNKSQKRQRRHRAERRINRPLRAVPKQPAPRTAPKAKAKPKATATGRRRGSKVTK